MKGDHIQASVPAPVASLPPRQPIPSVHFSMARSVHLSMAIDTLALEAAIRKLYKFHLLILDDFSYVTHEQAETSVLFELIGARYENRSVLVIANEPFSAWGKIFGSDAMTLTAVDRLVHRSHIFELNAESYRKRAAYAAQAARAKESAGGDPDPAEAG